MPLLITPASPFQTTAQLTVPTAYAIINEVSYARSSKEITFTVGYYASEEASTAGADILRINALPTGFVQAASPEQANAVPIFQFLEQVLTAQLTALLPEKTTIESVA